MLTTQQENLDSDLIKDLVGRKINAETIPLEDFMSMPISTIKSLNNKEVNNLRNIFNISTIKDLNNLHYKDLIKNKIKLINIELIDKILDYKRKITAIIVAKSRLKTKIIFLGIDNAGKSTIVNMFKKNIKKDDVSKIQPTISVKREKLFLKNFDINILDLGGQKKYRNQYLENPERFFNNLSLIFYVIDIQDDGRYEETLTYLKTMVEIINDFVNKEECEFIILIHKYDPEILEDVIYIEKYEYLTEIIEGILKDKFNSNIFRSSIFNLANLQDEDFLSQFNSLFTIEESMDKQVQLMNNRIDDLSRKIKEINSTQRQSQISNIEPKPRQQKRLSEQTKQQSRIAVKSELLQELKGIFRIKAGDPNI